MWIRTLAATFIDFYYNNGIYDLYFFILFHDRYPKKCLKILILGDFKYGLSVLGYEKH